MSAERLLALPEITESSPKPKVTSETFVDYLFPHTPLASPSEFDYHLDLGFLEEHIDDLYEYDKQVGVLSEAERERAEKISTEITNRTGEIKHPFLEMQKMWIDSERNKTGKAERSRILLYDTKERQLALTKIKDGEYRFVNSGLDLDEFYSSGLVQLLRMHTHPENSIFSSNDYLGLLVDTGNSTKVLKGELLLCPDVQVLAFSTTLTPSLKEDQMQEFISQWRARFEIEDKEEIEEKNSKIRTIDKYWFDAIDTRHNIFLDESFSLLGQFLSPEEKKQRTGVINTSYVEDSLRITERFWKARCVAKWIADTLIDDAVNRVGLELARSVGVQLYTSTDRRNFYAATA